MCHWKCQGYLWILGSRGNLKNLGISAALSGSGRREKLFILGMVCRELGDTSSPIPWLRNPKSCSFLAFCSPWIIHIWGFSWRNLPAGLQSKQWQHPRISAAPSSWNSFQLELGALGNLESQAVLLSLSNSHLEFVWNSLWCIGKLKGEIFVSPRRTQEMQEFLGLEHF